MTTDPAPVRTFHDALVEYGFIPAPVTASSPPPGGFAAEPAYIRKALADEVQRVRTAEPGTRNDTLNKASYNLGQLVAGAGLDRQVVAAELHAAASLAGLGDVEALRTIRSGLDSGAKKPRGPRQQSSGDAPALPAFDPAAPGATVVTLADVVPERVAWLWPGRLPLGKLVVLDGDPAVGKSTLTVDLAARLTTGSAWPDGEPCPMGHVVVLSAEDGLADTIRPRLDAAGADPAKVHALTEVRYTDDAGKRCSRSVTLADVPVIEQTVRSVNARLVVVDVLMAYLPGKVDSHRDQDIRTVLAELAAMAERTGCCVLLLRHLNKATGGNPLYRGGGSIGIVGAARAAMLAAVDPDDENRRILAVTKSNLAAMPAALAYQLVDAPDHGCARVEWRGATEHRAADLLGRQEDDDERGERDYAAEWLVEYLTKQGPTKAGDVIKAARSDGIAERTLKRARQRAGVESVRRGFGEGAAWSIGATIVPIRPPFEGWHERPECGPNDDEGVS